MQSGSDSKKRRRTLENPAPIIVANPGKTFTHFPSNGTSSQNVLIFVDKPKFLSFTRKRSDFPLLMLLLNIIIICGVTISSLKDVQEISFTVIVIIINS